MAMAQNYQPPKWMVFLLNMIISVSHWYHNLEPNPNVGVPLIHFQESVQRQHLAAGHSAPRLHPSPVWSCLRWDSRCLQCNSPWEETWATPCNSRGSSGSLSPWKNHLDLFKISGKPEKYEVYDSFVWLIDGTWDIFFVFCCHSDDLMRFFAPFISKCPRLYASVQLEHRGLQPAPQKNQG